MRRFVVAILVALATILAIELAAEQRKKRSRRYYGPQAQQWEKQRWGFRKSRRGQSPYFGF